MNYLDHHKGESRGRWIRAMARAYERLFPGRSAAEAFVDGAMLMADESLNSLEVRRSVEGLLRAHFASMLQIGGVVTCACGLQTNDITQHIEDVMVEILADRIQTAVMLPP